VGLLLFNDLDTIPLKKQNDGLYFFIKLVILKKISIFAKKNTTMNQFIIYSVKHCGLEGYSVARKFLPLIVSVLFLIPGLSAQSTWVSQVERYANQTGQNLIVRTATPNSAVMCSKAMLWTGEHTFRIRNLSGGTKGFNCNLSALLTDSTSTFVVKDMYIFNKGCYFCGYITVQAGEPLYNNQGEVISTGWYSQGVVGFFDLRDLNLPNATLHLLRVAEVDSLMHLVVHQDDPFRGPLIMAVGRISINLPSSCVVELQCPLPLSYPNTWTKRVVHPQCFDVDEYLTDIILTDSFLEVVSKLPYWGEDEDPNHYIFRLHQTKREGFYATSANMSIPVTVAQYSVQGAGGFIRPHQEDEPISLCSMNEDRFCVTYGTETGYSGVGNLVVFRMNSSQTMEKALWSNRAHVHCHVRDVAYLKDLNSVAILSSEDNDFPGGIVWIPDWDATDDYDPMYWQGKHLWSIDCMLGEKVIAGGTYVSNSMFQTLYDPVYSIYHYYESLCVNTYGGFFEQFPVSEPTIFDCVWKTFRESFMQSQIFEIPVEYFPSFSDCLIDEDQWQRR
jgi:hypothetical protein